MRKKYILKEADSEDKYWDRNWSGADIENAVKFCEISPLHGVFEKYFPRDGKILEGGCGIGQFVIYYKRKGFDIEGVDFAENAVNRTLELYKDAPVKKGNVLNLEYPDNYFKAYYSGGVVEHFEEGPFLALKEAHRVLRKDGLLIISVPFFNLSRVISSYFDISLPGNRYSGICFDFDGTKAMYSLVNSHKKEESPVKGFNFHQYEYTAKEFSCILEKSGFEIISSRPFSLLWGLMDFSIMRNAINRQLPSCKTKNNCENFPAAEACSGEKGAKAFMKKIIINEDHERFFFGKISSFLGWNFGNMMLFVCRTRK